MARKLLLEHINVPGINTFDVYRSKGGYAPVLQIGPEYTFYENLTNESVDKLIEDLKAKGK